MFVDRASGTEAEARLDEIIAGYLEACERGEPTDPQVWLQKYPEFNLELRSFFAAESRFDQILSPLRTTPALPVTLPEHEQSNDRPPKTMCGYELLAEIGRGGMGVIYKARQVSLNRLVAVKMIRSAEWATPSERMRFRWEAEAVGRLDHPNIVPIYEVDEGRSEDGTLLPFFSMKLIEGENLALGRGRFRGDWRATARLLALVARAVEHAHQRGILHRDLKPANVLLGLSAEPSLDRQNDSSFRVGTSTVTPHVTDFGLAARAQQADGPTLVGTIVGTPAYLAPELATGSSAATIASDVYALGAILYELLTGEPPFRADTPLETIVKATTSPVTPPRKRQAGVPLDLETVCLKCLEPDPRNRYPGAGKLALDLDLYLDGRPISARPVGSFTAFRRWCRRQPVIAGLSAALLLLAAVSFPLIVWNWRRAVEHERLAEQRLAESLKERERANDGFELAHSAFGDLFRAIGNPESQELSETEGLNKELLERGLKYYRDFVDRRRDDPAMRRELASALFRIAAITQRIKSYREFQKAYEDVIEVTRALLEQYPDDTQLRELLARSLTHRGKALLQLDQVEEAIRSHEEAVEVWARLPGDETERAAAERSLGIALTDLGLVFQNSGNWPKARDTYHRAKAVLLNCKNQGRVQSPLAVCCLNVALAEKHFAHLDVARRNAEEGRQIAERLYKKFPNAEETQLVLAQSLRTCGDVEQGAGNPARAKELLIGSQQLYEGLLRARPRVTQYRRSLAMVLSDLASLEKKENNPEASLKALEQAVTLLRELKDQDGESRIDRSQLAGVAHRLGDAYKDRKNFAAAAKAFEEAREQRHFLLSRRPSDTDVRKELAGACLLISHCYGNINKHAEALPASEEAVTQYRIVVQQKPSDGTIRKNLGNALGNKAISLRALGRTAEAITTTEERARMHAGNAESLYDAALDFARTYNAVSAAADPDTKDRALHAAADTLRQALVAGLPNLDRVRTETTFKTIRETDVFKKLMNGED